MIGIVEWCKNVNFHFTDRQDTGCIKILKNNQKKKINQLYQISEAIVTDIHNNHH